VAVIKLKISQIIVNVNYSISGSNVNLLPIGRDRIFQAARFFKLLGFGESQLHPNHLLGGGGSASGSWVLDGSRGFCFLGFFVSDGLRVLMVSAGLFGSSVCSWINRVLTSYLLLIHYTSLASSFPPTSCLHHPFWFRHSYITGVDNVAKPRHAPPRAPPRHRGIPPSFCSLQSHMRQSPLLSPPSPIALPTCARHFQKKTTLFRRGLCLGALLAPATSMDGHRTATDSLPRRGHG
jgi:hypothetical protein